MIRYHGKVEDGSSSLSRRDVSQSALISRRGTIKYFSDIPTPISSKNDSYFGYAVTSGYFLDKLKDKLLYVASAPQGNYQQGEVGVYFFF